MKPVFQTIFGTRNGNCLQACLASIFELPLEDCVDVSESPDKFWFDDLNEWLSSLGYTPLILPMDDSLMALLCAELYTQRGGEAGLTSPIYSVVIGDVNGNPHACVYRGLDLVHDPFPGRRGFDKHPKYIMLFCALNPARFVHDRSADASAAAPGGSGNLKGNNNMEKFATKGVPGFADGTDLSKDASGNLTGSVTLDNGAVLTVTIPETAAAFNEFVEIIPAT